MTEARRTVSIGDGIIDAVELEGGPIADYPGGAALNLAVGLARLGLVSTLVTRFGADRRGFLIARYLRDEGVAILNPPNVDFTGVAFSRRHNGEPTYEFSPKMFRRRISFSADVLAAMSNADAVAVNSFPFDDHRQTDRLVAALGNSQGLVIVDPNPRPRLIADMTVFREGAEKAMAAASLVKLSDEDIDLFYDGDQKKAVARLFGLDAETLLLTHGSAGASLHTKSGIVVSVGIAQTTKPVVDTMGAGDATLATVIAFLLRRGMPADAGTWRLCLEETMRVAAETCAHAGGGLRLPRKPLLSMRQAGP